MGEGNALFLSSDFMILKLYAASRGMITLLTIWKDYYLAHLDGNIIHHML